MLTSVLCTTCQVSCLSQYHLPGVILTQALPARCHAYLSPVHHLPGVLPIPVTPARCHTNPCSTCQVSCLPRSCAPPARCPAYPVPPARCHTNPSNTCQVSCLPRSCAPLARCRQPTDDWTPDMGLTCWESPNARNHQQVSCLSVFNNLSRYFFNLL